jgi:hypothetical protein
MRRSGRGHGGPSGRCSASLNVAWRARWRWLAPGTREAGGLPPGPPPPRPLPPSAERAGASLDPVLLVRSRSPDQRVVNRADRSCTSRPGKVRPTEGRTTHIRQRDAGVEPGELPRPVREHAPADNRRQIDRAMPVRSIAAGTGQIQNHVGVEQRTDSVAGIGDRRARLDLSEGRGRDGADLAGVAGECRALLFHVEGMATWCARSWVPVRRPSCPGGLTSTAR